MAENLASRKRMKAGIEVYAWEKGEKAIKLEHISQILENQPFESETSLHKE